MELLLIVLIKIILTIILVLFLMIPPGSCYDSDSKFETVFTMIWFMGALIFSVYVFGFKAGWTFQTFVK